MDFMAQKYRLYVSSSLLFYEKQKIQDIFNSYNNRLTIINNSVKVLLNDINNLKSIEGIHDEKIQFDKLFELINNNNINEINNEIKIKCNNIDNINNEINENINTKSEDFKFIKSICEDKLTNDDKHKIINSSSSDNSDDDNSKKLSSEKRIKKDEYNRKRREKRLVKKNQQKD